jgi:hypothetical protein
MIFLVLDLATTSVNQAPSFEYQESKVTTSLSPPASRKPKTPHLPPVDASCSKLQAPRDMNRRPHASQTQILQNYQYHLPSPNRPRTLVLRCQSIELGRQVMRCDKDAQRRGGCNRQLRAYDYRYNVLIS